MPVIANNKADIIHKITLYRSLQVYSTFHGLKLKNFGFKMSNGLTSITVCHAVWPVGYKIDLQLPKPALIFFFTFHRVLHVHKLSLSLSITLSLSLFLSLSLSPSLTLSLSLEVNIRWMEIYKLKDR